MGQLRIPHRNLDQPLAEALSDLPRHLPDAEDRAVARHLLRDAASSPGFETVGDLLDHVEQASPEQRREIADAAREACGLTTMSKIEEHRELARATSWPPTAPTAAGPKRAADGKAVFPCAASGCERFSSGSLGEPQRINVRRWWCSEHRHLAQPGDDEPVKDTIRIGRGGGLRMTAEAQEHYASEYERVRRAGRKRTEERSAAAAAIEKIEERYRREAKLPPVAGVPQGGDDD
jgi:hypothetical protein